MKRPLGYLDGLGTGIGVIALAIALVLASASSQFEQMYRDMNSAVIAGSTALVLSVAWRVGVPLVLIGAFVAGHVWRPRYLLLATAIAGIAVDVFWYLAAYAPIFELSGNIR